MKIIVEKDSFLPLLSQVQGILEKKTNIPILSNILIEAGGGGIFVYASDSEISFSGRVSGAVKEKGRAVVSGKKLFEIVREFSPGKIKFFCGDPEAGAEGEEDGKEGADGGRIARIEKGQSKYQIHCLPPEEFPSFPPLGKQGWEDMSAKAFLEIVEKTIYCAAMDESRYHLTGVFCEKVSPGLCRFVATDGHRMSFVEAPFAGSGLEEGIIIPRKGVLEIKKMLLSSGAAGGKMSLSIEKPRIAAKFKGQTLSVRLIEANYPNYRKLIPKEAGGEEGADAEDESGENGGSGEGFSQKGGGMEEAAEPRKKVVFRREDLAAALRRISVMTSARFRGVNFDFEKKSLKISTVHSELGEATERAACRYEGESLRIRFNSRYVLEALQSFSGEKTAGFLKNEESSILLQEEKKENCKAVIMPMKP